MANCNCSNNSPQPCCQDCAQVNPCDMGCLDSYFTPCVTHSTALTCLGLPINSKLNNIIDSIDAKFCDLSSGSDKFVRVSAIDPSSGYLFDKIKTCNYLTKVIINEGGQQKLSICLNVDVLVSGDDINPVFMDIDGLAINYTTLVDTIVNTPALLQVLCDAISGCTPSA